MLTTRRTVTGAEVTVRPARDVPPEATFRLRGQGCRIRTDGDTP